MQRYRQIITTFCVTLTLCAFSYVIVRSQSSALRRITSTAEESISINPSLSGDGRRLAFESTANIAGADGSAAIRFLRAELTGNAQAFEQLGATRAPASAISQDGSLIAFASKDNPLGTNADGNSEIFFFDGATLRQLTNTLPGDATMRTRDGNFQPSISDDGRFIAFSSNRDLVANANADANFEIFLYDTTTGAITQLTDTSNTVGAIDAKISGDSSHIAFINDASTIGGVAQRDIILQERAGNTQRVIASAAINLAFTYGRAISDDGTRIVYAADTGINRSQIFLYDARDNSTRQITALPARADDVSLHPTISGNGSRIAFATRRNVNGGNADASIEVYVYDLQINQFVRITEAPATASGFDGTTSSARRMTEVVSSLNDDGSSVAFNFPRVLSGAVSDATFANNSEIYLASIQTPLPAPTPSPSPTPKPTPAPTPAPTPVSGALIVVNGASFGTEPATTKAIAPGSISIAFGQNLSNITAQTTRQSDGSFPQTFGGATLTVNNRAAQLLFVSPTQINFIVPAPTGFGTAQIVATNSTGAQSRGSIAIVRAAVGIFTQSENGSGEAVALDADSMMRSPFDSSSGSRHIVIFTTGLRNATQVNVTLGSRPVTVERFAPSSNMQGMDELQILLPAELRSGSQNLSVRADDRDSNTAQLTISNNNAPQTPVVISEFRTRGTNGASDEFIELYNNTGNSIDIGGWKIKGSNNSGSSVTTRLTVNAHTTIPARGHFLAINSASSGYSGTVAGNQTFGVGIADDGGIALTMPDDAIVDQIGLSSGSAFKEGTILQPLTITANQSYERKPGGASGSTQDTDDNASDFQLRTPSDPQNLNSAQTPVPTATPTPTPSSSPTPQPTQTPQPTPSPIPTPSPTSSPTPSPSPSPAAPPTLVISQLYGGGGNSGAPLRCDFVEIFNRGTASVDFAATPFSVQYTGANSNFGSSAVSNKVDLKTNSIAPGQYYLIQGACGAAGSDLPAADTVSSLNLAQAAGKVALVASTTALLAVPCPSDASISDFAGYGTTATCFEGTNPAPAPSNITADIRNAAGCTDTNNNAADFTTTAPAPRNTASPLNSCNATPSPTPTPTPSPSPSPSPKPSPSPSPDPSPFPTPSPTPSPSPTPTPSPTVSSLMVTPATATINRGATQQFTAQAFDANNNPVAGATFTYLSGNAAIATIAANGLATGVSIGTLTITATTSNGAGGTVSGTAQLTVQVPLVINEVFADVPTDNSSTTVIEGDANRDGVRDADDDEFVELLNNSNASVDLSGVRITDATNAATSRFTFPQGTTLAAGRAVVVFGGAQAATFNANDPAFGGALVLFVPGTGTLGLNDAGDTVTVKLSVGSADMTIATVTYGGTGNPVPAPSNQSLTRSPDAESGTSGGNFVAHTAATNAAGRIFSPGTRADGTPFGSQALTRIEILPAQASINAGATQSFSARAFSNASGTEVEIPNVSFIFDSSDTTVATVNPLTGTMTKATAGINAGTTTIRARAGGQQATSTLAFNSVVASIDLQPDTASITVGASQTFTATARDANNSVITGLTFSFSLRSASPANTATITAATANTVTVRGDNAGSVSVVANYTQPGGATFEDVSTLTINAAIPTPSISINDATITEGNAGTVNAVFTVTLSNASDQIVTVDYATANVTATASTAGTNAVTGDYEPANGTLTFNPGDTVKTLAVVINGDTLVEPYETFNINLSAPTNATIADHQGVCTIENDDAANLVIGQVYGGGNNSGATFQNDFVELFNKGNTTVDFAVTNYSVQYASATGNFTAANKLDLTTGTMEPGQYFLIKLSGGTTNGAALPAADAIGTINLSATAGKVALAEGTTLLGGSGCPIASTVADFIGYGSANCAEGNHPTAALSATKAARRTNGCTDTNDNAADFTVDAPPNAPRNSATTKTPCP